MHVFHCVLANFEMSDTLLRCTVNRSYIDLKSIAVLATKNYLSM